MQLLPKGTLRRRVVEAIDRRIGLWIFGDARTLSTHLGNRLKDGTARSRHLLAAALVDFLTLEQGHCFKNAGKS